MAEVTQVLSPEQRSGFFEAGFTVLPRVFARAEIERMRAAFERLRRTAERLEESCMHDGAQFVLSRGAYTEGSPSVRIHRIVWCGAAESELAELGRDPRLLAMAAELLGSREMQQLINQAHFKLPGDGVEFGWHQDSTHRRYGGREWTDVNGRGSYVQTVTAIDDVTQHNGPLEFLPGSCALGHLPSGDSAAGELPVDLDDPTGIVAPTMSAGSVLLFGPYVFHRSRANHSDNPRRVFINGFAYPGANRRIYPGDGAGRMVTAPSDPQPD